jgi:hypothetical protein
MKKLAFFQGKCSGHMIKLQEACGIRRRNVIPKSRLRAAFETCSNYLLQTVLAILKFLADLGNTVFVDTLTEICILAKVSKMIPVLMSSFSQ